MIGRKHSPLLPRLDGSGVSSNPIVAEHDSTTFVASPCLAGLHIYNELQKEYDRIRQAHPTIAPTGCTRDICQSGRAVRLNEPRVGRDRPISEIQQEAVAFLQECRKHSIIDSDAQLEHRIQQALAEIKATAVQGLVADMDGAQKEGLAGGFWQQSTEEVEFGIRMSWRNSRKCIMRSKYEQLVLCDLRNVTSSEGMAHAIVGGMIQAFNGGRIVPTTFIFPPRRPRSRGPMIWNHQILAFAGYHNVDGSILGDPANVSLTEAIIELGWVAPAPRSPWDMLPLVTMADGDVPYLLELPAELRRTVAIVHPRYKAEFSELELRWVLAPALSRFGFDIGGNQYTASPFVGWFMDAEIGVRNLADTFRYNALPKIVRVLDLSDDPSTDFEDLPEYMKLAALSRAQAELNYAVYHSYLQARITMVDSFTGSADYQRYDQQQFQEMGYRLPADPYWLSPPQGSIVPLWHQGAAPNYQPKPMICKHVQDPIKAWRRQNLKTKTTLRTTTVALLGETELQRPKIGIYTCSSGVSAGKMAKKLFKTLRSSNEPRLQKFDVRSDTCLNFLDLNEFKVDDVILVIASTTGRGEIPSNAMRFMSRYSEVAATTSGPRFSVFGNGDSTYEKYNAAGINIHDLLKRMGCQSLTYELQSGDTAINNPDWTSFQYWIDCVRSAICGRDALPKALSYLSWKNHPSRSMAMMSIAETASITSYPRGNMMRVRLNIGNHQYQGMDHIKIMPPNPDSMVTQALMALKLEKGHRFDWHHEDAHAYFSKYVDLDLPFKDLNWFPGFQNLTEKQRTNLTTQRAIEVITNLKDQTQQIVLEKLCQNFSSIQPKVFSIASSPAHEDSTNENKVRHGNTIDIIVKKHAGGRFSDVFLQQARQGTKMRFGLASLDCWKVIEDQPQDAPLIAITTGSGIGPLQAILQHRVAKTRGPGGSWKPTHIHSESSEASPSLSSTGSEPLSMSSISSSPVSELDLGAMTFLKYTKGSEIIRSINIFAGFKQEDSVLVEEIVSPALQADLVDVMELVPSNEKQRRVQDHLMLPHLRDTLVKSLGHPQCIVFVCANEIAAEAVSVNLSSITDKNVRALLKDRYIEEIFRY